MLPASNKNLRSFGFVMAGALLAFLGVQVWRGNPAHRAVVFPVLAALSLAFAGLALAAPRALRFVYRPWMAIAHYMGLVMTTVLMTLFFFTLLVPFTLIRLKDPLRVKLGAPTYWEPHKNPEPTLERFQRPF